MCGGKSNELIEPIVGDIYYPGIFPQEHDRRFAVVAGLIDAVANSQLKVLIDRVFPLAEAAQAHRYILERKAFGRVLLRP